MEKFLEPFALRPNLDGVDFKVLSEVDTVLLENSFFYAEIKSSGWDCEDSKSPGPDRYNFVFLRNCWSLIGKEFCKFFRDFCGNSKMLKAFSSSFLTLIPKNKIPLGLDDYMLICLVGCVHKILSKMLALRLKKVLGQLVSSS